MASTYSTLLRLELIGAGEQSGTWGVTTNTNLGTLLDQAIAGRAAVSMGSDANYTLTANSGTTDEARQMILNIASGVSLTATRSVICPTSSKLYVIKNATTGGQSITLKTAAGTGITVPNGKIAILFCDGTNVVDANTYFSSVTLGTPLAATSGGTGLAAGTSGGVPYFSSSTTIASSAALTASQLLIGGGAGAAPTSLGSLGTTTQVLHGNAAGAPTFGAVALAADVSGTLPVANGGTGATSATAYAVQCGGTTSTGAHQSIASVGTAGQVLTSAGAGALPSFQNASSLGFPLVTQSTAINISFATHCGKTVELTGSTARTWTFDACASLTSSFSCILANNSTAELTLDPNGAETIDGLTSFKMYQGEKRLVTCDGLALYSFVLNPFYFTVATAASPFTFTKPPGYLAFGARLGGGGASGGKASNSTSAGGGGGGGSCAEARILASTVGTTETIAIGVGGAAQASANSNGTAGGNTTLGSLSTGYGGGRGGGSTVYCSAGGGGGLAAIGGNATAATAGAGGGPAGGAAGTSGGGGANSSFGGGGGGDDTGAGDGGDAAYGGGGGGGGGSAAGNGGASGYGGGGGGGGSGTGTAGSGGASVYGGAGGAGSKSSTAATAGTAGTNGYAGGGGGGSCSGNSGAGGDGSAAIWGIA